MTARPELVARIGALVEETGSTPDELRAAVNGYLADTARVQALLDEAFAGDERHNGRDAFAEVLAALETPDTTP